MVVNNKTQMVGLLDHDNGIIISKAPDTRAVHNGPWWRLVCQMLNGQPAVAWDVSLAAFSHENLTHIVLSTALVDS